MTFGRAYHPRVETRKRRSCLQHSQVYETPPKSIVVDEAAELGESQPILNTLAACCASAMTAKASSTTTNGIDKTPAFLIAYIIRYDSLCIMRAVFDGK